ncbi:UDP-N-acetylmuramate dehydrogenase [Acaryochloris sp. IP29b_bin.137]|uniref:UDP-N-acetylmuramate dehydrogenase n=1 Tax=Acaryochloris sp. IP29b_bin.137 TaxID=2969217 RepID=UPI0026103366|nr:UDP-N-acetylmuramate dehydrogenase [Acaryochloris sp. IP29b_bin.137]
MTPSSIVLADSRCTIHAHVSLADMTTFRVGGAAEWFIAPKNLEELQASYAWAHEQKLPITFLGAGSNLLISDQGLPGLVIATRYLRERSFDDGVCQITAYAGEPLPKLAWQAAKRGWAGMEWAVGIPGTVGGALVMNAGAHGGCTADILAEAHILDADGSIQILTMEDMAFQYRSSVLQQHSQPVVKAVFQLHGDKSVKEVQATTQSHLNHRLSTQPYDWPSCGSVFRNPLPRTAGWLIEQSGLKGYTLGGAQVAQKHANFILNSGNATATDIFTLIRHIQHKVEENWSLLLKPEVKMLGEFPQIP